MISASLGRRKRGGSLMRFCTGPLLVVFATVCLAGCGDGSMTTASDDDIPNIEMANPDTAPPLPKPSEIAEPVDPPPALDPWMKIPPLALRDEIDRLLRCGGPEQARRTCNLAYHEGATAQSPTEEVPVRHYSVSVMVTMPPGMYDDPPTVPFPRAPFRVVHHLLPRWRQADAWLTFAMQKGRRSCGLQTRVGNALISLNVDLSGMGNYEVLTELAPYRASTARKYAECIADYEGDVDEHAEALSRGLPWRGSQAGSRR